MFSIDHYLASIQPNLEKHTDQLIEELQNITTYKFDEAVDLIDFSAFLEPTSFELSIMMFSMDKDANEVFGEDVSPTNFAGSLEILPSISYYHLPDEQYEPFWDAYEQRAEELEMKEQQIFTEWFIACWIKANGNEIQLPTYFGFHDQTRSYYLQKSKFVEDEEKWV